MSHTQMLRVWLAALVVLPFLVGRGIAAPTGVLLACVRQESLAADKVRGDLEKTLTPQLRALTFIKPVVLAADTPAVKAAVAEKRLSGDDLAQKIDFDRLKALAQAMEASGCVWVNIERVQTIDGVDVGLDLTVAVKGPGGEETLTVQARASKYEAKYAPLPQRRTVFDIASQNIMSELRARSALLAVVPSSAGEAPPEVKPADEKGKTTEPAGIEPARDAVKSSEPDQALRALAQASAASPRDPALYVAAGDIYVRKGRLDYATLEYKRAVFVDPKNREALYKLADTFARRNQPTDAIETAQRVLALGYDDALLRSLLAEAHLAIKAVLEASGRLLTAREERDKALGHLQKATELDKGNVRIFVQYGKQLLSAEKYREAALAYKRVTELAPADAAGWQALALSLLGIEDYRGGVDALQRSVELRGALPVPVEADIYPKVLRLTDGRAREIYLQARADITEHSERKIPTETLLQRAQKELQAASKIAELMRNLDPPVGKQKSHLQRTLSYQLISQAMTALVTFVETNDVSYQEKASLLLTEFVNEYEAARQKSEEAPPATTKEKEQG